MKKATISNYTHLDKTMRSLFSLCVGFSLIACSDPITNSDSEQEIWPRLAIEVKQDPALEKKVEEILSTMTLEQKIAQMIQPEIRDISVEDMRKYGFGSYLNGGGAFPNDDKHASAQDWINLAEQMYQASIDDSLDGTSIPTMWGTDAVHGHNNVIGATLFPHNIGLGAANNPELIEEIAKITATEVMVTGIDWVFAPTVAVVRDDRWGRSYEGYSEDPEIVKSYSASIVRGLQGHADQDFLSDNRVISTVKHFLGDGGTEGGDDQGDNIASEQELFDIHAQGYVGGLSAGAQSVMASFNSWHGKKIHGNKYLLTDVLKDRMGFDGFVVGDWNGHGQIQGCSNESCPQAVNAGLDIFMVPTDAWKPLYENTIAQVNSGVIPLTRIDDAVSRILRVKLRADLFNKPSPAQRKFSGKTQLIGAAEHRAVAQQAVRESLVLLKNNNAILPILPNKKILVAGDGAHNIGKQSGGWSLTWQGTGNENNDFPGATSIYQGIETLVTQAGGEISLSEDGSYTDKPDVAIVVFGEEPYAEGHGDVNNLEYQRGNKQDLALLSKLKAANIPVVSIFISGRPMWTNAELNVSDAFVAAWLPGTEGQGIAEVLLAKPNGSINHDFVGKLSFSWPKYSNQTVLNRFDSDYDPLFAYGYGLTYQSTINIANDLNETVTISSENSDSQQIFTGKLFKPWDFTLHSGEEAVLINSSSQQVNGLMYRTADRNVQEDAIKLSFLGKDNAGFKITSFNGFPEDLLDFSNQGAALNFAIKLNSHPDKDVTLQLECEHDCSSNLELAETLQQLPLNEWQNITVPMECLLDDVKHLAKITTIFSLKTAGKLEFTLSDVTLSKSVNQGNQVIQCKNN